MDADQAARIRAGRRTRKTNDVRREAAGLLSALDLLYCGFCGRTVKTWTNSRTRANGTRLDYYGCQQKNSRSQCPRSRLVPQPELDGRILGNIFRTLGRLEKLAGYWASRRCQNIDQQLADLEVEEQGLSRKRGRLIEAVAEGVLDLAEVRSKKQNLETALSSIQEQRRALLASQESEPDWNALNLERDDFDLLTFQEQRQWLKLVLKRVDVFSGHAILTYRFPRNAAGDPSARINLPAPKRQHHKNLPQKFTAKTTEK